MTLLIVLLVLCLLLVGVGAAVHALFWLLIIGAIAFVVTGAVGYRRRSSIGWRRR